MLASSVPAGNLLCLYGLLDKTAAHGFEMVSLLCQKTWSHNYFSIQLVFAPESGPTLQWVFFNRPWQCEIKRSDCSSSTRLSYIRMWFLLWLMPNPPGLSTVQCVLEGDLWASHLKWNYWPNTVEAQLRGKQRMCIAGFSQESDYLVQLEDLPFPLCRANKKKTGIL